jgi:Subtilase family
MNRAVLALLVAVLPFACLGRSAAVAQNMMRSPTINMPSRIPSMIPDLAGRVVTGIAENGLRVRPPCGAANRESSGDCSSQPVTSADGRGNGRSLSKKGSNDARSSSQATSNSRAVANEIVAEIDGALSDAQADALARRHGLIRIETQNFPLIGGTIGLFRVANRRTVEAASRDFSTDNSVRSVQPNFRYVLQEQNTELTEGDPAQYANAKLRLPQAHTLAHGTNVTVAVIDSGIDLKHPEFASATIESFDALGSKEGPHVHGTGIAGAIVSRARLMGSAPAARVLAIRAFGAAPKGAESTSYVILKALDYAAGRGAQIVNMSFAGPKDAVIERGLAALAAKGVVTVAAAGNAGPKSPPLYPAAYANVIAVSATDAQDKLFAASNRGSYVAIAAPGVEIFLPAPDQKYQMVSGTSFSAAYISGLAALILERNPGLNPGEVRMVLTGTARDLGPPGRDDQFGAGEADAFAAVSAVSTQTVPVAEVPGKPEVSDTQNSGTPTAGNAPPASVSEKPATNEIGPAAR